MTYKKDKRMYSQEELLKIQEESQKQALPEQKRVFSVSDKIRRRVHNLPDPVRPPLGYDEHKAFDRVFPYMRNRVGPHMRNRIGTGSDHTNLLKSYGLICNNGLFTAL